MMCKIEGLLAALVVLLGIVSPALSQPWRPTEFGIPPEVSQALPPSCNCTDVGISGGVDVNGRIGCGQHLRQSTGDLSWTCYVIDPSGCPESLPSNAFPGAYYRGCNPAVDVTVEQAGLWNRTLQDIIRNVPDLSILTAALDQVGLLDELGPDGSITGVTIFAPSDSAFEAMFLARNFTERDLLGWDKLVALLLGHIVIGEYTKRDLVSQAYVEVPTASPSAFHTVDVRTSRRVMYPPGQPRQAFRIIELDNPVYDPSSPSGISDGTYGYRQFVASNGVLQIINGVMGVLRDVTGYLAATPTFSTFYQAMNKTGVLDMLGSDCPNATTGECKYNPITVWAPTNTAFQRLASSYNITVTELLNLSSLEDIVLSHITDPAKVTVPVSLSALSPGEVIPTLYGNFITVGKNTTYVRAGVDPLLGPLYVQREELVLKSENPQAAGVASQGTKTYNGLIYPITRVLLPYTLEDDIAEVTGGRVQVAPSTEGQSAATADSGY